jgi:hypothetical protein
MRTNLEENLDNFLDEQITCDQQGYVIDNQDKADWALRKIKHSQQKIDEAKELKEKRIAQINLWYNAIECENNNQISYFESLLTPYAETQLKGSKKRSFNLPNGTIGFRKSGDKFTIDGEEVGSKSEKLIKLLEESYVSFVEVEKKANWGEFKKTLQIKGDKVITADGEVLEDIKVELGKDRFYAKGDK